LALVKLQRHQKEIVESKKDVASVSETMPESAEVRKKLKDNVIDNDRPTRIEIIRNLKELENGFYLVADTFEDAKLRDEFALKISDSGETETSFFYNVNNFSYYVYVKKYETSDEAIYAYNQKINKPNFDKLFIVHIQNEQ